jgi:hypothetical protein
MEFLFTGENNATNFFFQISTTEMYKTMRIVSGSAIMGAEMRTDAWMLVHSDRSFINMNTF